jgi:hypothetical protein
MDDLQGKCGQDASLLGRLAPLYHNWYHNEAQEGFANMWPKRLIASRCMWGITCE